MSYNVLRQTVLPLARRKQNMVKAPPLPPTFEIHAPKTIGHLLGLVPIYPASTILLTTTIFKISRGNQLGRTDGQTDRQTDGQTDGQTDIAVS